MLRGEVENRAAIHVQHAVIAGQFVRFRTLSTKIELTQCVRGRIGEQRGRSPIPEDKAGVLSLGR